MRYPRAISGRRCITSIVSVLLAAGVVVWGAPSAVADCVSDPDALGFREMIRDETTGEERFPVLLLGIVVANRDFGGDPDGGRTIARVRIVEHPVGSAPGIARVRFWKTPPGVGVSANLELEVGGRYALVARRLDDGSFRSDGACGESRRLNRERFRELVRYARLH